MKSASSIVHAVLGVFLTLAVNCGVIPVAVVSAADTQRHLSISDSEERLFEIPFYFATPETAWLVSPRLIPGGRLPDGDPIVRLPVKGFESIPIGLRLVVMRDSAESRATAARKLSDAGLLSDGDVLLVFHPEWEHTMPYPHIQMGISHAGTVFTENGQAFNIDMPLDETYNGTAVSSRLDSEEYLAEETFHVVRPRTFSAEAGRNLRTWAELIRQNYAQIRAARLLPFNQDYLHPIYSTLGVTPLESVQRFGSMLCAGGNADTQMKMYCSEFAWHLLTLSSVAPFARRESTSANSGLRMIFPPKPFVGNGTGIGLSEGPLAILESLPNPPNDKLGLIEDIFAHGDAAKLSAGHQTVARSLEPEMEALRAYYRNQIIRRAGRLPQSPADSAEDAARYSAGMPANYSPASFLLNSLPAIGRPDRSFDYMFTLTFVSEEGYRKALKIAAAQNRALK